jgi:hypothetical protein
MSSIRQAGQTELQELAGRLMTAPSSERINLLGRVIALDCQSVDCAAAVPPAQLVPDPNQTTFIKARRFVAILNEHYTERQHGVIESIVGNILHDFERTDPLVKGIAVRHAGRLSDDVTCERLVRVVIRGASVDDPYVRKAAALAILNLHLTRPSYIDRFKLGPVLKGLVEDSNLNVAANAVAALSEINAGRVEPLFVPSGTTANNLLTAIDQATEWSQVEILDFVTSYQPQDASDARGIIARVVPRLSHANPAVVFAAVRCCLTMNAFVDDQAKVRDTLTKVVLPLVTQLNNTAPVQFTAVKTILVLLQKYRRMLASEVSIFFCKFDDPLYIKLAKLDVILTLVTSHNVGKVLEELFDYAQQTDVEFVRKTIRAIGKVAVEFPVAADACVDKIAALVDTKGQYVVQECTVIAVDIFRRYPGKYEGIIGKLNSKLTGTLDDHRAKAALAWIIGEYSDSLSDPVAIFNALFLDDFADEPQDVQLAILTAVVKFYLNSDEGDDLLRRVLSIATNQIDNPDVRDRAFMYLALVQGGSEKTSAIVLPDLADLPTLTVDLTAVSPVLIDALVPQVGTLSVLYEKLPNEFVESTRFISLEAIEVADEMNAGLQAGESSIDQMPLPVLVESANAYGAEVCGSLVRIGDSSSFIVRFRNFGEQPLTMKQIAFDKNVFGFAPGPFNLPPAVGPQKSATVQVPVIFSDAHTAGARPSSEVRIAILVDREAPIIFSASARLDLILLPADQGGKFSRDEFVKGWGATDDAHEVVATAEGARIDSVDVAKHKMQENRLFFQAKKDTTAFFTGKTVKGDPVFVFLVFERQGKVQVGVRMGNLAVAGVILELVRQAVQ